MGINWLSYENVYRIKDTILITMRQYVFFLCPLWQLENVKAVYEGFREAENHLFGRWLGRPDLQLNKEKGNSGLVIHGRRAACVLV